MGREIAASSPAARQVFETADRVLGFGLSRLCFEGPAEVLVQTINAQPAILACSLACLAALRERVEVTPALTAGHSLGEYSALVAVGALTLEDGLRAVRERGRLMQEVGDARPGTMAAVVGLPDSALEEVCSAIDGGVVCVGNYNAPGQATLSGDRTAVERAGAAARERGARRVMPLHVSGAFHSPLMAPAAERLQHVLESIPISAPRGPLVANATAEVIDAPERVRDELNQQIRMPVRWSQTVEVMCEAGVDIFIELGPGQVLSGLIRRIAPSASICAVSDPASVEEAMRLLQAA